MKYYLAVDIGASSGRHILGHLEDGRMVLEEVYRFPNGLIDKNGHKCWDKEVLLQHILTGMKKCAELGKKPVTMAIDTWGVDFVLVDEKGDAVTDAVGYRDARTDGMEEKVYEIIPEEVLYERTGIQKQIFNTIYQLMAVKEESPELLEHADRMLMTPEYYSFLLTGKMVSEYTNATTGQLVNAKTKDWDFDIIEKLGFPKKIFGKLNMPGTPVGKLKEEVQSLTGLDCLVVLAPSHDTASAVLAVPSKEEHVLYISSGTWSLMGTERTEADCTEKSRLLNFTNEGGINYRFRYLKNIMGLWMINSARKELAPDMSFTEICDLAEKSAIKSIVPANDERFLAPESMVQEVQKCCRESGQEVPETMQDIAAVIYNSLAACYAKTVEDIEEITGITYPCIHIVGGGSNADLLNRLTAERCKKTVYAGPGEGTAIGNIASQMIREGEITDLAAARKVIFDSFEIKTYEV